MSSLSGKLFEMIQAKIQNYQDKFIQHHPQVGHLKSHFDFTKNSTKFTFDIFSYVDDIEAGYGLSFELMETNENTFICQATWIDRCEMKDNSILKEETFFFSEEMEEENLALLFNQIAQFIDENLGLSVNMTLGAANPTPQYVLDFFSQKFANSEFSYTFSCVDFQAGNTESAYYELEEKSYKKRLPKIYLHSTYELFIKKFFEYVEIYIKYRFENERVVRCTQKQSMGPIKIASLDDLENNEQIQVFISETLSTTKIFIEKIAESRSSDI
ncbi:MAG: hypothetical protein AB7I41_09615 [Candidatus Sericytochromatia bacterium]